MYCGSKTIATRNGTVARAFPLRCRSWGCPACAPRRRARLIAEAKEGKPNRFVTLTVNPNWYETPAERGARLVKAWRDYVREQRRLHPQRELQYLAVIELTARGEPHIHLAVRGAWIDQKDLSNWMAARMGAPVVDVRLVRGEGEVARYVAKYISKRSIKLGNLKRYWRSTKYLDAALRAARRAARARQSVWIIDDTLAALRAALALNGRIVWHRFDDEACWTMYAFEKHPPGISTLSRQVR